MTRLEAYRAALREACKAGDEQVVKVLTAVVLRESKLTEKPRVSWR